MSTSLEHLVGSMTVSNLAQAAGVDVAEAVAVVMGGARASASASGTTPTVGKAPRASTRGPRPRAQPNPRGNRDERAAAYTAKVRDVVLRAKAPISAPDIRAKAGGNASGCRAALARLIEHGIVAHDGGSTRARRYLAA